MGITTALREKIPRSPRKYTIKCLTCGIELRSIHSDFAKDHLVENPTHLEYRVSVEIQQIDDTKKTPRDLPIVCRSTHEEDNRSS